MHNLQGARSIVQREGIGGLYHGLLPTLLRDVPDIAIQFTLYERLRRVLERRRKVAKLRTWEHLILGGLSGPPSLDAYAGYNVQVLSPSSVPEAAKANRQAIGCPMPAELRALRSPDSSQCEIVNGFCHDVL